jgi:hypothetical protein
MQATITTKRFALNHIKGTALAFGILVSSLTAVTTLGITGDLPGQGQPAASAPSSQAATVAAQADAEQRQLAMERDDYIAWRQSQAGSGVTTSATAASASEAERRQLQMERQDFYDFIHRDDATQVGQPTR